MKQVIVTGGTGVTGNALVRMLLCNQVHVTALIRPGSIRKRFLPTNHPLLNMIECDMDNYSSVAEFLKDYQFDAFFHLSWEGSKGKEKVDNRNNFKLQNQNVSYALDAVELCYTLSCPVFLMTGSQAEYGRRDYPINETEEKHPENGYGMAKLCAEGMTRLLCKKYGIRHIWPILFSVYGPYDATESLIDISIRKLLKGDTIPYTKGEQMWDYLYSEDAAKALILLAIYGKDGETYNIASGSVHQLHEYINTLYEELAPEIKPRLDEIPYLPEQTMYLGADTTKLHETTGFVPSWDFRRGVREIVKTISEEA